LAIHPLAARDFEPAYLRLPSGELHERARRAVALLEDCRICPRDCGVNRLEDKWAACKTGRHAQVSSYFPPFGEEDCLRGWNGSGTIFFSHCNLRCVFCQNYDISQALRPGPAAAGSTAAEIAEMALELQRRACHNINFVTPEHVAAQVVEAIAAAAELGLHLPIVYNTSAYDSIESIELLDGIVDIYMPDFKYWSPERSATYMKAANYPAAARAAIRAMHRQVGPLVLDPDGLARRGLLLRHLVMPGCLDETRSILEWIAGELGPDTYVNLMDQYHPAGRVSGALYPEINRRLSSSEFQQAWNIAHELGLHRLDGRSPARASPAEGKMAVTKLHELPRPAGPLRLGSRRAVGPIALALMAAWAPAIADQPLNAEYVGSRKCRTCHLNEYRSWEQSRHAKTLDLLKPGERRPAKELVGLDPEYDYRGDPYCLPCHTVGYGQPGGFVSLEATPALDGVGCEACHGAGSRYVRSDMMGLKNLKHSFDQVGAEGLIYPVPEPVCARCHSLASPFNFETDPKYGLEYSRDTLARSTHEHRPLKHDHGPLPPGVLFQAKPSEP